MRYVLAPKSSNIPLACGLKAVVLAMVVLQVGILAANSTAATTSANTARAATFGVGESISSEAIAEIDIDILPDGRGLPGGSGTVSEGAEIYAQQCAACHGLKGQGGPHPALAGGRPASAAELSMDRDIPKTIGNYWGYATTLFSYIRRAMPYDRPGSLSDDQVYALSAYLLYLNELVDETAQMDAATLPRVFMPAREFYWQAYPDMEPNP